MTDPGAGAAPATPARVLEDVVEVLWAPAAVFDRARAAPLGRYLLVVSLLMFVTVLATKGLLQPFFDAQFELGMRQAAERGRPVPTGAALETARAIATWSVVIGSALAPVGSSLVTGLFLLLAGKVVRAPLAFSRAALVVCLASVPRVLGTIATAAQGLVMDPATIRSMRDASLGPARFADPETTAPQVLALLANLDVWNLWMLALMAIGVSVMARVSRGTGALAALVAWGLGAALSLGASLLSG